MALNAEIAKDAARSEAGQHVVSMATVPMRHAQGFLARQGSAYDTNVAVAAVVYAAG